MGMCVGRPYLLPSPASFHQTGTSTSSKLLLLLLTINHYYYCKEQRGHQQSGPTTSNELLLLLQRTTSCTYAELHWLVCGGGGVILQSGNEPWIFCYLKTTNCLDFQQHRLSSDWTLIPPRIPPSWPGKFCMYHLLWQKVPAVISSKFQIFYLSHSIPLTYDSKSEPLHCIW